MKRRTWISLALAAALGALGWQLFRPFSALRPLRAMRLFAEGSRERNFREFESIFPTRRIRAADTPWQFEERPGALPEQFDVRGEPRDLEAFLERAETTGLLVVHGDAVVFEQYFDGSTGRATRFTSFSVAKSFTSTLVGLAVDDGLLGSVEDRVEQYLPEHADSAYGDARIRDVLQMASGVRYSEAGPTGGDANRMTRDVFFWGTPIQTWVTRLEAERAPGERFQYASSDTVVLGQLVESVTGRSLSSYLEERIWHPLGMESDAAWVLDDDGGTEMAFFGLNATLRDFARFGRLFREHGDWNGTRILSEAWVLEATSPSERYLQPDAVHSGIRGYQYQWWVPVDADREYFASGIWGQNIWISEPDDVVIVRTAADPDWMAHMEETIAFFRAVSRHFSGTTAE